MLLSAVVIASLWVNVLAVTTPTKTFVAGHSILQDINTAPSSGINNNDDFILPVNNSTLFWEGSDGANPNRLRSNKQNASSNYLIPVSRNCCSNLLQGSYQLQAYPKFNQSLGNFLVFITGDFPRYSFWISDGTASGTYLVKLASVNL